MAVDWDAELLAPAMAVFGEGDPSAAATWPVYTPRDLPPFALAGAVFDSGYLDQTITPDGVPVATRRPVLGIRTGLFPRPPAQNDAVFIPATPLNGLPGLGMAYLVQNVEPDGHGCAKLMLMEKAS